MSKVPSSNTGNGDDPAPELLAELRAATAVPDDQINTDDVSEVGDWTSAVQGRFYRPLKRQVTLREYARLFQDQGGTRLERHELSLVERDIVESEARSGYSRNAGEAVFDTELIVMRVPRPPGGLTEETMD